MRWRRRALVGGGSALLFGCSLIVSTSGLNGGGETPPPDEGGTGSEGSTDATIPSSSDGPIAESGSPVQEGGCPPADSGVIFCDDFDEVTSPSSQWTRSSPVKDGGFELDLTTFVSAPHSIVFHAPPVDFESTAALSGISSGPKTRRTRTSFDVKVDQHAPSGAIFAIGPNPYPDNVAMYFISLRVDDNEFTYNAGIQLNGSDAGPNSLFQRLGGNPSEWTHFDVDYDVNTARIDVRMNGALRVTDTFPAVPAEGISYDIGLVELQTSPAPWLIHFDNFLITPL